MRRVLIAIVASASLAGISLPCLHARTLRPPALQDQQSAATPSQPQENKTKDSGVFVVGDVPDPKAHGGYVGAPTLVTNIPLSNQPVDPKTRLEIIRVMNAEFAYTKKPIPKGEKGLNLAANGKLDESDSQLRDLSFKNGAAAHVGDRVQITDVVIAGRSIHFDLNGGPRKKHKWYEHISVGASGGTVSPMDPSKDVAPGSVLTLTFPKFVPELTAADVRALLAPVLDFSVKSPTLAYADTLPPKIRAAVLAHKALVGMNHEMVIAAVGRPEKKFRETDDGVEFEDWMYGNPPADVQFLRFQGDELIRIKTLPVGAAAIIRDKPEVDETEIASLAKQKEEAAQKREQDKQAAARPKPSLRRDGEPETAPDIAPGTITVTGKPSIPGTKPSPGDGPSANPGEVPLPGGPPNSNPGDNPGSTTPH